MLSVRLILLVLATLICDLSLGGEANDMMDKVLAEMLKMNDKVDVLTDKVDVLTKKVNGMEETDQTISTMEVKTAKQVAKLEDKEIEVKNEINIIDKKVEKVDSEVLYYNTWLLFGMGQEGSHTDEVSKDGTTLKECLEFCHTKRTRDGGEWDGVVWRVYDGKCYCEKSDQGHVELTGYLHFIAQ